VLFGVDAYTASDNALRQKSGLAMRDYSGHIKILTKNWYIRQFLLSKVSSVKIFHHMLLLGFFLWKNNYVNENTLCETILWNSQGYHMLSWYPLLEHNSNNYAYVVWSQSLLLSKFFGSTIIFHFTNNSINAWLFIMNTARGDTNTMYLTWYMHTSYPLFLEAGIFVTGFEKSWLPHTHL